MFAQFTANKIKLVYIYTKESWNDKNYSFLYPTCARFNLDNLLVLFGNYRTDIARTTDFCVFIFVASFAVREFLGKKMEISEIGFFGGSFVYFDHRNFCDNLPALEPIKRFDQWFACFQSAIIRNFEPNSRLDFKYFSYWQ